MYLTKEQAKDARGVKLMKSKDRITIMVTTSASGIKLPLYTVGKYALPVSVRVLNGGKFPVQYTSQIKAWFNEYVMVR